MTKERAEQTALILLLLEHNMHCSSYNPDYFPKTGSQPMSFWGQYREDLSQTGLKLLPPQIIVSTPVWKADIPERYARLVKLTEDFCAK